MWLSRNQVLKFADEMESSTCESRYSQSSCGSERFIVGVVYAHYRVRQPLSKSLTPLGLYEADYARRVYALCRVPEESVCLAHTGRTWYYPVYNFFLCLSEPTSQKSASARRPTDSFPVPRLPLARKSSLPAAVKAANPSRSLQRTSSTPMLPRSRRLTRATFPDSRAGYRAASQHFSLSWGAAKSGGAAAIVSKKVARRSVDRHLLKRRMLSVVRPYAATDRFLIAYARAGSPALSFTLLKQELTNLLARST